MTKQAPRVLQVVPSMKSGGVERGVMDVARALNEAGYMSFVASKGGVLAEQLKRSNTTHFTLNLTTKNPFKICANARKIAQIIKENNINIVHGRSRAPAWSAYKACKMTGCKFITTVHGPYSIGVGLLAPLKKKYNSVMVKGDHIIAVSNFIKKYIAKYGAGRRKIEEGKVHVIHRGVDVKAFDPANVSQERIILAKQKLRLPDDKPIITLPGRLTGWKGQEYLVDALIKLPHTNFFCLILGDNKKHPEFRKRLEKKINASHIKHNVQISDNVLDVQAAYMLSDIVVSASTKPEAFGRVAVEGQAMKRIVVATNIGGSLETVIDKKTGFLVPHNNAKKFAEVLDDALNLSDAKRDKMANAARKHATTNFSMKQMCDKTLEVYEKVLYTE